MVLKLTGFGIALVVIFGASVAVGAAVDLGRDETRGAGSHGTAMTSHGGGMADGAMAGHGEGHRASADDVRGLGVADHGLRLQLERTSLPRAQLTVLRFAIKDQSGERVTDFDVEHERRLHLIVVRRDGTGFQHVHPDLGADGVWSVPLTLADAGAYRVFADFSHDGEAQTLAADVMVDGDADYRPLPTPADVAATGDGYTVHLDSGILRAEQEAALEFTITRDGERVLTEDYLGAGGHLVALREGDLAFLHVHPDGGNETIRFMSVFPSAGRYRLYLQFKDDGRVHTAEFTREVSR